MEPNAWQIVRYALKDCPTVLSVWSIRQAKPSPGKERVGQGVSSVAHIGTCLPVGLLRHDPMVRLVIELEEWPQYLQTYLLFSSPS